MTTVGPMMSTSRALLVGGAALLVVVALAGCQSSPVGTDATPGSGSTAVDATTSATPIPTAAPTALAAPTDLPTSDPGGAPDQCRYLLAGGTWVPTPAGSPLPAVVLADLQRRIDAIPVDTDDPFGTDTAARDADRANWTQAVSIRDDVAGTCRRVTTVRQVLVGYPGTQPKSMNSVRWMVEPDFSTITLPDAPGDWQGWGTTDKQRQPLLDRLDAFIAQQPNAATWVVVAHS